MLADLLLESQKFAAEYGEQLSNHLPMVLIALYRIGASQAQSRAFMDSYVGRLALQRPAQKKLKVTHSNWRECLGQHLKNSEYREFFLQEIAQRGRKETVQIYLDKLLPGLSGGAFHPLIRLAFGLEAKDSWEVAEALASWCMAYQELGPMISYSGTSEKLAEVVFAMSQDKALCSIKVQGSNIFTRMKVAAENNLLCQYIGRYQPAPEALRELANLSINLYRASNDNFAVLHMVTVCHASRALLPYIQSHKAFTIYLWQAIAAAYMTVGCFEFSPEPECDPQFSANWEDIFSKARESKNDHVAKFCFAAFQEWQHYGNELYRIQAAKKVGL